MLDIFTEVGRVVLTIVAILSSATFCTPPGTPSRSEALRLVTDAITSRATPGAGSDLEEYFVCEEYQRLSGFEFIGASAQPDGGATAIVQIAYEYTVSSVQIKDDLIAGKTLLRYRKYSCSELRSLDYFQARYWPAGSTVVVPGEFYFVRSANGWALR